MYKAQTVYLPVEITEEFWRKYDSGEERPDYEIIDADNGERLDEWVNRQEGYFFTPEQLNEYTQSVIKQALETASENADTKAECEYGLDEIYEYKVVDKESITNTFEETYRLFFVD
jgi:hypothetical protein